MGVGVKVEWFEKLTARACEYTDWNMNNIMMSWLLYFYVWRLLHKKYIYICTVFFIDYRYITNIGIHNTQTNTFNFSNMNIDIDKIISNINSRHYTASTSNNCISRETNITIQNGKRIEHIIETINGVRNERTIVTDLNSRLN